jgi:hypothetical protein
MNIGFTKPNNYDGKSSWTDYQVHFETVSKLNQWTDEIKALKFIGVLDCTQHTGDAGVACICMY